MRSYDVDAVRRQFPALARTLDDGTPIAWLDGPAGTQVPSACLDAMTGYLRRSNANTHGMFAASAETEALIGSVRAAMADLLGASDPDEISFGPNMTTITFALSRAIGATLRPGDGIVLSRLDHDANVAPWLAVARERDLDVRWIGVRPDDCTLELDDLEAALDGRPRLVAVGLASNAVGTINPVAEIARRAHEAGALVFVDAVHAAPHVPVDVAALGADLLVCSAYKVYGPHVGVLWGRRELLERLPVAHVRPVSDTIPDRLETGTQGHELLAGLAGTIGFLEWVGVTQADGPGAPGAADGRRRARLLAALGAIGTHERELVGELLGGLGALPGIRVHGIVEPARAGERCPTVGLTLAGHDPAEVAGFLGLEGIHAWDGDFYAWELIRVLGLERSGGLLRVGLVGYSTREEVDRLLGALESLSRLG